MKKILVSLMMAAVCFTAMGQDLNNDLLNDDLSFEFGDSKWEGGAEVAFLYNASFNAPAGMSLSGFGMEIMPFEMRWKGWKGGALTLGILDMFFDWQFLQKGNSFSDVTLGQIVAVPDSDGSRFNFGLGFPVGINQQFSKDFGISLAAIPGVGWYTYNNTYDNDDFHKEASFYPKNGRVHFQLDLKAVIWYGDFGVMVRYNPLKAKDINTTILSVGLVFHS